MRSVLTAALCLAFLQAHASPVQQSIDFVSSRGHARVVLRAAPFSYQVFFDGAPVLLPSPLGLEFADQPKFGTLQIVAHQQRSVNRTWHPVWSKSSTIVDHYIEEAITFKETGPPFRELGLRIRCYDRGIAFRYILPVQRHSNQFVLTREETGFQLPDASVVWAATYKDFRSAYEEQYRKERIADVSSGSLIGLPLLVQTDAKTWAAISEADLTDWAGMYLTRSGKVMSASLSPRRDGTGLVKSEAPRQSPWRVIMLAHAPGELIESNLIENLSQPSQIADTTWIKPGMMAWDHWWSGDVEMTTAADERFIDFAAHMGFPYQLVDWQWYGPFNKPQADITRPAPQLDMTELLRYAKQRHVRLWLWIHSGDVDRALAAGTLDQAFAKYEEWGIAGVKIDFMNSDDQDRVRWYAEIVRRAAAHHLMVDFHGAFKPTGLYVTWPNLLTREGVLGNEYNKFSDRDTPAHKATLPFTRGLAGPMDYTPGGFLNRSPEEFRPQKPTEVMGSRANELALFVVYWSPLTCVSDDPAQYVVNGVDQPGLSFLRELPTVWDETRALDGAVGQHVIVVRRKGTDWWLGGITADAAYDVKLPLSFLGSGRFVAHVYQDPAAEHAPYSDVEKEAVEVSGKDTLGIHMRPAGGIAIRFARLK